MERACLAVHVNVDALAAVFDISRSETGLRGFFDSFWGGLVWWSAKVVWQFDSLVQLELFSPHSYNYPFSPELQ